MSQNRHTKVSPEKLAELPIVGKQPENEKEDKFLREIGEYEFYNLEEPGLSIRFPYGNTNRQKTFTFFHSAKYTVPRFIARHLESCSTPLWEWRPDGNGRMEKRKIGTKPRYRMSQVYN